MSAHALWWLLKAFEYLRALHYQSYVWGMTSAVGPPQWRLRRRVCLEVTSEVSLRWGLDRCSRLQSIPSLAQHNDAALAFGKQELTSTHLQPPASTRVGTTDGHAPL